MKTNFMIGFCIVLVAAALSFAATDIRNSTGALVKDTNQAPIDVAPNFSLVDGTASAKTITNLALTTNVVTLTSNSHGLVVGQQVVVALLTGPTLFADCNGTYLITAITANTFSYALTHADIITGAATGTAKAYWVSQIPTATTQIALVFPAKAIHLVVVPTVANAKYSKVSSGTTNGTFTLFLNVANHIDGVEGDTVYIQRANTTPLDFVFDLTR